MYSIVRKCMSSYHKQAAKGTPNETWKQITVIWTIYWFFNMFHLVSFDTAYASPWHSLKAQMCRTIINHYKENRSPGANSNIDFQTVFFLSNAESVFSKIPVILSKQKKTPYTLTKWYIVFSKDIQFICSRQGNSINRIRIFLRNSIGIRLLHIEMTC